MEHDPETTVRELLKAAGLAPSDEEVAQLSRTYPALRAAADELYTAEISSHPPAPLPPASETGEG